MGLDAPPSLHDGFFASAVFKKIAIMTGLSQFDQLIPACYGTYHLSRDTRADGPCFFPPICFPFSINAIEMTKEASVPLKLAHEEYAADNIKNRSIIIARPRLDIPNR
jgi:hypothetical protein